MTIKYFSHSFGGIKVEETFVKDDSNYWTRSSIRINGYEYCPCYTTFLNNNNKCNSCEMQDENKLVLSEKELDTHRLTLADILKYAEQ